MLRRGICFQLLFMEPLMSTTATFNEKADSPAPLSAAEVLLFLEACEHGDMATIKRVLEDTPQAANLKDEQGQSALQLAVSWAGIEGVELLLRHGADTQHRDAQGQSAQDLAARLGYHAISQMIDAETVVRSAMAAERFRQDELALFTKGLPGRTAVRQTPIRFK